MRNILHGDGRVAQRHELDGGREHQSQAPRAQRPDNEQGLHGQPIGEQQRGKPTKPRAGGEPPGYAHSCEPDHRDGDKHAFRRNTEERVRETQIAEFHEFRLPGFGDIGAGEHTVDIAGEQLVRFACQAKRFRRQHE